jgi:hypothetical protein
MIGKEPPARVHRERTLHYTGISKLTQDTNSPVLNPEEVFFLFDMQLQRNSIVPGVEYGTP